MKESESVVCLCLTIHKEDCTPRIMLRSDAAVDDLLGDGGCSPYCCFVRDVFGDFMDVIL